jgi:hypothetical protein
MRVTRRNMGRGVYAVRGDYLARGEAGLAYTLQQMQGDLWWAEETDRLISAANATIHVEVHRAYGVGSHGVVLGPLHTDNVPKEWGSHLTCVGVAGELGQSYAMGCDGVCIVRLMRHEEERLLAGEVVADCAEVWPTTPGAVHAADK